MDDHTAIVGGTRGSILPTRSDGAPSKLYGLVIALAAAALSGGLMSALLKSWQFLGIFKQELTEIVASPEFVAHLSPAELEKYWSEAARALFDSRFPHLWEALRDRVRNEFLTASIDAYYENVQLFVHADWDKKDSKNLIFSNQMDLTVVAADQASVVLGSRVTTDPGFDPSSDYTPRNETPAACIKIDKSEDEDDDQVGLRLGLFDKTAHWDVTLSNRTRYDLRRHSKLKMVPENDNIYAFNTGRYIVNGLKVLVQVPDDVRVEFRRYAALILPAIREHVGHARQRAANGVEP